MRKKGQKAFWILRNHSIHLIYTLYVEILDFSTSTLTKVKWKSWFWTFQMNIKTIMISLNWDKKNQEYNRKLWLENGISKVQRMIFTNRKFIKEDIRVFSQLIKLWISFNQKTILVWCIFQLKTLKRAEETCNLNIVPETHLHLEWMETYHIKIKFMKMQINKKKSSTVNLKVI